VRRWPEVRKGCLPEVRRWPEVKRGWFASGELVA
jgi:hypothetical protein